MEAASALSIGFVSLIPGSMGGRHFLFRRQIPAGRIVEELLIQIDEGMFV
jgi:hypothetical protein